MADSYIFNANAGETPETVARRRQVADALAARIFGRSPQNIGEGIGAIGQALIARQMSDEASAAQKAGQDSGLQAYQQIASMLGGGGTPAAASSIPPVTGNVAAMPPMGNIPVQARPAPTVDKIYSNDEPSPLDPPSGQDRDLAVRTIVGEAANQGPTGMNAVASVIRNRAVAGNYGGNTAGGVVMAPNQFEPWNGGPARDRMMALQPTDPRYVAADRALDMAYAGNDPTNGATMFFAPKAQAALGRPAPTWGQGPGQDIGDHRFFGGAPVPPTQVASADPNSMPAPSPNAAPAAVPQQPQAAAPAPATPQAAPQRQLSVAQLAQVASNPWLNEGQKGVVNALLKQAMDREQKASDPVYQAQLQSIPLDLAAKRQALEKAPTVQKVKTPDGSEVAVQWDANSSQWVPLKAPDGGNAVASPKLTEQQSKDVGFYNRGAKLLPQLERQDQALLSPYSAVGGSISNYLKSDEYRNAEQTGKELLAVILRKDTGAAVTPSEMQEYGSIYLPKPGDDQATLMQKRASRQTAMEGLRMGLGSADIIFKSREAAEAAKAQQNGGQPPASTPAAPQTSAPAPAASEGATAFNPATGETIVRKNGKWVPLA